MNISEFWQDAIVPALVEYIRIPAKSPHFDRDWQSHGYIDEAARLAAQWCERNAIAGMKLEIVRLDGRGGADDGYAVFCAIAALRQLHEDQRPHRRCVILIECCEESGSFDLPAYLDELAPRIGTPSFVVGLDSGCGNYSQLWGTTSLRGLVNGVLTVEVLTEGVHSGDASGVVASSFRIARALLERLDSAQTGVVSDRALQAEIPT